MPGWHDPHRYVRADTIDPRTDTVNGREVLMVTITRDWVTVTLGHRSREIPELRDVLLGLTDEVNFPRDKLVGIIRDRRSWRRSRK